MLDSLSRFCRSGFCCAALLLIAATAPSAGWAQAGAIDAKAAAAADTPQAVKHGELTFHGNYCGIGNRAGADPVDALDVACMHHDACTPTGKVQSCACNQRLAEEATAVAQDPRQPAELRSLATLTAAAATAGLGVCVTTAQAAPVRQAAPVSQAAPAPQAPTAPSPPVDLSPPLPGSAGGTEEPVSEMVAPAAPVLPPAAARVPSAP